MEQTLSQRMELFSQMISCGQNLSYWEFDPSLQLVYTTCEEAELFHNYLLTDSHREDLLKYIRNGDSHPLMLVGSVGLNWIVSPEIVEEVTCRVHMIGPIFTSDISTVALHRELSRRNHPPALIKHFSEKIREIPVVPLTVWLNYGLMLHYCVTGIKLEVSDFAYAGKESLPQVREETLTPSGGTWYAEQMAMKMVEEGRIDYKKAMTSLKNVSGSVSITGISSLRQCKNYLVASTTLVTRAAIRGGLDPQTAYHIGEVYLANIEQATDTAELAQLNGTIYDDFVRRVHKVRTSKDTSSAIQACCNYIDLHLDEKLSMQLLSEQVGYADYYLAQKFKKEMGMTVAQYIRQKRVEQAKLLLRSSHQSIAAIAEALGFCNSSHFSDAFRSITGMTPNEYREGNL